MMADRRRRSPEASSRRMKEPRQSEYTVDSTQPRMRSGADAQSIYSSSASSYEYIDISHSFPPNRSGLKTFFTAPSERRLRKRRSSRLLRHSNSSSESLGDLAYGHGYLRRPKRQVRSRKGKEIDREKYGDRERERERYNEKYSERYSDREREKSGIGRATTDAEILAVGAGLAKLAREQNKLDLKAGARGGKQSFVVKEAGRRDGEMSRGLGPSKISHGSDTVDEDGWESASDAGSESSVDSRLAFGAESQGGWGIFGRKTYKPQSRKSSIVDPRLFGPANSLHGVVTQPVGFGEVSWNSSSDFGQRDLYTQGRAESVASGSLPPMQHVYPYATEDSTKFDAARSSVISGPEPFVSSRPGPIPIQQPQPITPVSQSVYEPIYGTRSETGTGILKKTPISSGGRSKSLAEAALFGVAGAAVGAAIASDRKDDRKERRRDDDREEDRTPKRRDSERKDIKEDRKRDKRDSPDRDDRKERRRDKDRIKDSPEDRKDRKRDKRRDDGREETREERRERRREERRSERGDDRQSERPDDRYESRRANSDTAVSKIAVDPFQYQVDNDAFETPNNEPAAGHSRVQSVPTVVTVEREPDFTRKRGSSIKEQPAGSRSEPGRMDYADSKDQAYSYRSEADTTDYSRGRDSRDGPLHKAESIYEEERHFTAPIDAAAISAAIAAEGYRESRSERRRGERRSDYDYDEYDSKPRDKESKRDSRDNEDYDHQPRDKDSKRDRERDPIQEEADRAYREIVMARKIASQVIRSRTPSPNRSVIDKYEVKEEEEIIRIVTPPGMDDHKKKGLYDAPNADFELDHVLENPLELRRFSLPSVSRGRSNSDAPLLKKDLDAVQPRPFLNLVLPTPSPSPTPEKQVARSEPAQPSKPKVQTAPTAESDVVVEPRGSIVAQSPSASTVSKGVTWGENETKHFEVESPSEHRDEFVESPEMRARDDPVEQPNSSNGTKRSGWGAIAAGIIGAGAGAAAASSSDTSKTSKSSKTKENDIKQETPYEYRGVVVEPDSPPRSQRQRSPPTTGPKPTSQTSQSSRVPGAFDDDLDFTAIVAAGLQDTGFDPKIVINDPKFRRRDSPPGSNEPIYRAPYAETVSDFGSVMRDTPSTQEGSGFVIGEAATTRKDWPTVSPDEEDTPTKLSKKDQKKRDMAARRQSGDFEESSKSKEIIEEPEPYFETKLSKKEQKKRDKEARRQGGQAEDVTPFDETSVGAEMVDEPKKKSKKSKKGPSYDDDIEETSRKVSVPVDAFDDLRNGEDEWSEKKSKRKSKRDSDRYDSPSRSVASEIPSPLERSSSLSKKSKDKSKRKSDQYEPEPTEVSLPPSTPSETSRDGDFEESRRTRKSSDKDSADRGESRSVVSADASRYDEDDSRKSKRKSKSRDDFDDTRSVVSAPAGDNFEDSKRSKKTDKDKKSGGGFFGLFGSKSEVGTGTRDESPKRSKDDFDEIKKKSKKSKRSSMPDASSLYGDMGSQSISDLSQITSNGNGNGSGNGAYDFDDDPDRDSRDESKKKRRSRDESESFKKDSFLAKAGTLGAGVGLAGAADAIAAQHHQQSNADNAYESNKRAEQARSRGSGRSRQLEEVVDPEITQRQFRPSIDPQYGDLLPLPPSDPVSPNVEPIDDLPDLPDSRPGTPEAERLQREKSMSSVRKSTQDTPTKSPSHSAVPLKFIMGNRSNPSSPGAVRPSPLQLPAATSQDSLQFPRSRPRPTSWDSTKEYKPLYLVESNRHGSNVQQQEPEPLPALPLSQATSRSSSQMDSSDEATFEDTEMYPTDMQVRFAEPLSIDTGLAKSSIELLDSQQSTPKAGVFQYLDADQSDQPLPEHKTVDSPSLSARRSVSPPQEEHHGSHAKTTAEVIAGAPLVSSIGYFASSQVQRATDKSFLDELPSHSEVLRQPSPVDTMTKDRSSYLLQSSPLSRKAEDDDVGTRVEDSPTSRQRPLQSGIDGLHSIQERFGNDALEQSKESQPMIEQERERTLDTLSGSYQDRLTGQEMTRGLDDRESALESHSNLQYNSAITEAEPADEFVFTKSKKGKKKDKNKSKGLSRSSTQDDITLPETTQELKEKPIPTEVEPPAEFSLPKSKKDKNKRKSLSRPSTQDDFASEDTSREVPEDISAAANVEPADQFSMPKSKKVKKKDKKKGKSAMSWEPEEEPISQATDETLDRSRDLPEELPGQDDVVAAETNESKKEKKKNRKSVITWEPQDEASSSAPIEEPKQEGSRHILEEIVAPAAIGALGIAAYQASKHSEDPAASFLHQVEDKISKPPNRGVNVFEFQELEQPTESMHDEPTVQPERKEEEQPSESPRDIVPEATQEPPQETSIVDDFTTSTSKKRKKKGKKSQSWTPEEALSSESVPEPKDLLTSQTNMRDLGEQPAADDFETFVVPESKKSKTKGKKSQSWTPEESLLTESVQEPTKLPIDTIGDPQTSIVVRSDEKPADRDFEEFVTPRLKEGKEKLKSKAWAPEPESSQAQIQDDTPMERSLGTENIGTSSKSEVFPSLTGLSSKKGKKKSRKSQVWEEEPASEGQVEISTDKLAEPDSLAPAAELTSSGPTPMGGPGAWETAPSTPWATANEESPKSPSNSYFPSAAAVHSPQKHENAEDLKDRSYFPSAAALLPVTALGDTILTADHLKNKPDDNAPPEASTSRGLERELSQPDTDLPRPVPDGLKAGYDNDQLSLARQLQEEFGSGSKKSKKDKKKRQSLPATPDRDFSRSRDPNEHLEDHHRARSLSIRTSPGTERHVARPISEDRKRLYSEDQLELARQMKTEFEVGHKKSKKDKKKRTGLSRTSTCDDTVFDQAPEEPEAVADANQRDEAKSTRDGLEAGYQEDQLSLARQLQAEFGSGSKKSKKDKRSRSTAQTPTQEPEAQKDYFGETSQALVETARNLETAHTPGSSGIDKETVRDGLAVGYSEDQLELARQLKEEFSSGSSKSKNGKKDKKRQSLLRNTTEDDFSSDYTPIDGTESRGIDPQVAETIEADPSEPTPPEPEDEFAFMTKKSKRDKKGKKRDGLVPFKNDDVPPEIISKASDEPREADVQEEAIEAGPSELTPIEVGDEFAFTTKNSKKDKKGMKRDSVLRSTTDDASSSDTFGKAVEALHNTRDLPLKETAPTENVISTPLEDDWGSATKKSKKDKKKRQSLPTEDSWDQPTPEAESSHFQASEAPATVDVTAMSSATEALDEPADDFGFSTKKTKKDKKRHTLLQSSTFDSTPDLQSKETNLLEESRSQDLGDDTPAPAPTLDEIKDDGFEAPSKKSKKDKRNRQSTQESSFAHETPREVEQPAYTPQDQPVTEDLDKQIQYPIAAARIHKPELASREAAVDDKKLFEQQPSETVEENAEAQFENFAFTTKKSKKDKKNRKDSSVPPPNEPSGASTSIDLIQEAPVAVAEPNQPMAKLLEKPVAVEQPLNRELNDSIPTEVPTQEASEDPADEWDSFSTKKSKKDKKSRKSGIFISTEETPMESESTAPKEQVFEEPKDILQTVTDPVDDKGGSFTTKKSKKDKKNHKSGLSTPVDDTLGESETISQDPMFVEESKDEIVPEQSQDSIDNEWSSFAVKKSKKDKGKSKPGLSIPLEEVTTVEPEMTARRELTDVIESASEEKREESIDAEWGSFTTKTTKKDKKKSKSGLSTPLEETVAEPMTTSERKLSESSTPVPEVHERAAESEPIHQKEVFAEEYKPEPEAPLDDEWASFATKKSRKDKNKSGLSTPLETLAEPESSTSQRDLPETEAPKSQLEELMAGGVFTTKRSKKKNKSGLSTPQEDITQPHNKLQETQHGLKGLQSPVQEPFVEPEFMTEEGFQEAERQLQEPADDEWTFANKKSKKGKKSKSGVSTPLVEAPEPEPTSQEDIFNEEVAPQELPDAVEGEWSSFATKKSKKGKKSKSGVSTPLDEASEPKPTLQEDTFNEEVAPQELPDVEGEWSSSATKKSKNGKKSKSGVSTPLVEAPEPEPTSQEDIFNEEVAPQELPDAVEGEWSSFATKKSKKDKKRKSGLSTPIEEPIQLESSTPRDFAENEEPQSQLPVTEEGLPTTHSGQAPEEGYDEFEFTTKKSKKDKKKRKSGLSTPVGETLPPAEPEHSSRNLAFDEPTTRPQSNDRDVSESGEGESHVPPPEIADDGFEFTAKKSKKDKKGKRASRVNSESALSTSATPSASLPPTDIGAEDQAHLTSERFTQSPVSFEKDISTEQAIDEPDSTSTNQRETPVESQDNENDEFPIDLGRKPSKKDKRKRQATVANINDGPGASKTPLTSWADEVEEAEVEREVPLIQDIAKDESLSHIASSTEAAPIDDFSRPTKKGKKSTKRNTGLTRETSIDESFPPPIANDAPEKKPDERSDIPILAATGAALAGAVLLSHKSEGQITEPTTLNDPAIPVTKDVDIPPPTRKLSKKEKRKQSIDRRTPKDDPFDDPVLWEGAEPRSFKESKDANDDSGSDGFWSAPNRHEDVSTEEIAHAREAPPDGPVDLFAASHPSGPAHELLSENQDVHSRPPRDLPRPEQQWNDLPDENVTTSSKKDKEEKKASRLAAWDTPQQEEVSREIEQPSHPPHAPPPPPEPPTHREEEFQVERKTYVDQRPSTPPNVFIEESSIDRDLSFQNDQFRPRSSHRYSHHGASNLPIVREESPAQMESEIFERPSYSHATDDINRDSAFVTDSPNPVQRPFADEHIRDSGVHLRDSSPAERAVAPVSNSDDAIARLSWPSVDETTETVDLHRSQSPKVATLTKHHEEATRDKDTHRPHHRQENRDPHELFASEAERPRHHDENRDFLPSQREEGHAELHRTNPIHRSRTLEEERPWHHDGDRDDLPSQKHEEESHSDLHRTKTIHQSQKPDNVVKQRVQRIESPDFHRSQTPKEDKYGDLNTSQRSKAEKPRIASDNSISTAAAIAGATVGFAAARHASREQRPGSAQSQRSSSNINRLRTPDPKILRPESVGSNRSSGTPPLRRSDRKSGDLRSLSQRSNLDLAKEAELAALTTAAAVTASTIATPANPQANEGRVRAKEMADVYDGFGEARMGSPRSPTRPHSMRRRQSMQVLDLEQRLEQLAAENRALADAKAQADRALQTTQHASSSLVERDAELDSLKRTLAWLQNEVTRLNEVNDGLTSANITLGHQHNDRYNSLESQHAQASRELQEVRDSHNNLSAGMEGIVRNEVQTAVEDKDREIEELRAQLEAAKDQITEMQRQILASKDTDGQFLTIRDEDYFDNACQQLCQHVQQWVLRFSKFSDMRACRLTSEINNDKIIDRLDNAILDGSDVDSYLADRVKRRDVFMSMTMTMVWEFVFTRYLFGMDREQRQKLKSLEKLLSEVGPASAVHHWRATTLTLLSKRESFVQQREQDTLAVVNAVLETLTEILPPPSDLEQRIQEQLARVMKAAVDLSIEMRTQRAEYMMLPPLQPEYDANGDLASKVSFNAALMNERSGDTVSNEELEAQAAVVRIVLFPLVVKKGDDSGEGDEEIVVCPAQVLVAKPKKQVRIFSNGSQPNHSRISLQSNMPADYGEGSVI